MASDIKYTPEQEEAMRELRDKVKSGLSPELYNDFHMFYRFLKARNFNIGQAESMILKHLEWRRSVQLETFLEDFDPPEVAKKYASTSFVCFDKEGSIVRIMPFGNMDGKGLYKSANKFHLLMNTIRVVQQDIIVIREQSKMLRKTWLNTLLVIDCDNLTLGKITDRSSLEILLADISAFQDNFPELLKSVFIINASVYFTMLFPIVKAILVGPILEKVRVFGKDGWKEEFRNLIDVKDLPVCLGGNRTDPDGDPTCKTRIMWGGTVPPNYYLQKNIDAFASQSEVKKIIITRSSTFPLRIAITCPSTILEWEFEVKHSDIGNKVMYEEEPNKGVEEIVPLYVFETEFLPIKRKLKCHKPGTYVIIFSNKHSWLSSKEVYYRTWLTYPDKKENGEK